MHRRLTGIVAAALVIGLSLANAATYLAITAYLRDRLDTTLRDTPAVFLAENQFADHDGDPGTGPRASPFLQLATTDGAPLRTQAGRDTTGRSFTADLPATPPRVDGDGAAFFDAPSREPDGPFLRVRVSTDPHGRLLVVALPRTEVDTLLSRLRLVQIGVSAGALLVAVAAAWWLVRRRLAPLRRLAGAVESLRPDDPAARVRVDRTSYEVQELAIAANVLLQRVHDALAKEQAAQERLRQFIADASHELRTPIAAVSAYAQLFDLGAKDRPEDLARSMSGIQRETQRMHDLAEELLTLATLDGSIAPRTEPVHLPTVLEQAVDAARAVDPRWPVTVTIAPGVDAVAADPPQLRRVLDNLLGNVRVHTPPGTATRVAAERRGRRVIVTVADDGPGLTDEERRRMFDRFWRKDTSRSREAGGAGLGLSIVATLVASWGGAATASPTSGGGLTVTLTLHAR